MKVECINSKKNSDGDNACDTGDDNGDISQLKVNSTETFPLKGEMLWFGDEDSITSSIPVYIWYPHFEDRPIKETSDLNSKDSGVICEELEFRDNLITMIKRQKVLSIGLKELKENIFPSLIPKIRGHKCYPTTGRSLRSKPKPMCFKQQLAYMKKHVSISI